MAKSQKRSNKEIKKPKQVKTVTAPVSPFEKSTGGAGAVKKK